MSPIRILRETTHSRLSDLKAWPGCGFGLEIDPAHPLIRHVRQRIPGRPNSHTSVACGA
jgi:hypothetical protein